MSVHDLFTSNCCRMKSIMLALVLLVQMGGKLFPHTTPHFLEVLRSITDGLIRLFVFNANYATSLACTQPRRALRPTCASGNLVFSFFCFVFCCAFIYMYESEYLFAFTSLLGAASAVIRAANNLILQANFSATRARIRCTQTCTKRT